MAIILFIQALIPDSPEHLLRNRKSPHIEAHIIRHAKKLARSRLLNRFLIFKLLFYGRTMAFLLFKIFKASLLCFHMLFTGDFCEG